MSSEKRAPIVRDRYFIKRLDQGLPFSQQNLKGMLESMNKQPHLKDVTLQMLKRPRSQYDGYVLLQPEDTAPPDRLLEGLSISFIRLDGDTDFPRHSHANRWAFIYVVEGHGYTIIDGEKHALEAGDTVFIRPGAEHEFVAKPGPLHYLVVVRPDVMTPDPDGTIDVAFDRKLI
jgi:mannose-6-phosphate isomerase-like protein (cupin superfamily)